ncbi:MAG: hypothetical protein JW749_07235 [Sedimentisphaerales bacterium]|nr:hypothetical protein [Sedimentisphaerales bacterium]
MNTCTITRNLEIVAGTKADYKSLARYHYREHQLGPYCAIYALKGRFRTSTRFETVGVIVYATPTAGAQMRDAATGGVLRGLDKCTRLKLINKNIRTIRRVIIEPRFRSLGLAARLVSDTMPLMNVPFIEALAVMGQVNPFFEKAGMTRLDPSVSPDCARLIAAFGAVGVDEQDLIDPDVVQQKLDKLLTAEHAENAEKRKIKNNLCGLCGLRGEYEFIEHEMSRFLQSFGRRRLMPPGLDRTKFILSKLTDRPVYYFWQNQNLKLRF